MLLQRNSQDLSYPQKISGLLDMNFWLGKSDPKIRGQRPQSLGVLCRDPKEACNSERTASISLAVTEKIALEKNFITPSSGESGGGRGPRSRMSVKVPEAYNP